MKNIPAFPLAVMNGKGEIADLHFGMTLRDYFAAKAMQGLLAGRSKESVFRSPNSPSEEYLIHKEIVAESYKLADAMMEARDK